MSSLTISIPDSVRERAESLAREDGVSLDAFVASVSSPSQRFLGQSLLFLPLRLGLLGTGFFRRYRGIQRRRLGGRAGATTDASILGLFLGNREFLAGVPLAVVTQNIEFRLRLSQLRRGAFADAECGYRHQGDLVRIDLQLPVSSRRGRAFIDFADLEALASCRTNGSAVPQFGVEGLGDHCGPHQFLGAPQCGGRETGKSKSDREKCLHA